MLSFWKKRAQSLWWAGGWLPALVASAAGGAWCACRGGFVFVFPLLITFSCWNLAQCSAPCAGHRRQIRVLLSCSSTFWGINLFLTYWSPKELKFLEALLFWGGGQWAEVQAELITAEASSYVLPLPPRSENSFEESMRRRNHKATLQMWSWLS